MAVQSSRIECTRGGVKSGYTSHTKPALFVSRNTPVPEYKIHRELKIAQCEEGMREGIQMEGERKGNLGMLRNGRRGGRIGKGTGHV